MVLSDFEIKKRLKAGDITIKPIIDWDIQIQPASVDLRLGNSFIVYKYTTNILDLKSSDFSQYYDIVEINDNGSYLLMPHSFVLGTTLEWIRVPADLVARVDGRSTLGRLGVLIHATAGYVDPGFEGNITLELSNANVMPINLYPGMRICQISFETLLGIVDKPYGVNRESHYMGQKGVTPPSVFNKLK